MRTRIGRLLTTFAAYSHGSGTKVSFTISNIDPHCYSSYECHLPQNSCNMLCLCYRLPSFNEILPRHQFCLYWWTLWLLSYMSSRRRRITWTKRESYNVANSGIENIRNTALFGHVLYCENQNNLWGIYAIPIYRIL